MEPLSVADNDPIGFIGAGIMGRGMVQNLLKSGSAVHVIAHRNRQPIDELVGMGAIESLSLKTMANSCSKIILCLPNSETVKSVVEELMLHMPKRNLIIDCSTNEVETVKNLYDAAQRVGVRFAEAPLTGGQQQAIDASLGAIVGCGADDFDNVRVILAPCCARIEHLGAVGMGATTKLISNFLALGTATLVVESMKAANLLGVDWEKFYHLAAQGSGHSMSLDRIAPRAIGGSHDGYVFTIENTLKDLGYICDLLPETSDAHKLAENMLSLYREAFEKGMGSKFLSARLDPKSYEAN
ncbi:MAG TPA: 6-phosphogluconate dehydrogenase [Flavobacteriales bacterium]|nr:6-phosphogluconate dehydrogenase [Flavobacteriales bacterium]|tara:strand:- start:504 stop:1397 length:894 start_codon:yes stop_codon:yes gene_type:complete